MYRTAALLYFVCFAVYILFSRQPYYFDSELTPGTVVEAKSLDPVFLKKHHISEDDAPIVKYAIGRETFYYNGGHNYLAHWVKPFTKTSVIYDPGDPANADIYQFWGYWILMKELIFSVLGFAVLLAVAISITGKPGREPNIDPELERQMKYN